MSDNQQDTVFQEVTLPSATEGVIDQIINAIKSDAINPGEKLPAEPELASKLGVSRNTLREALQTLIEKKILFRERGVGTFVTPQSSVLIKTNLMHAIGTSSLFANQNKRPGQRYFSYRIEKPPKVVAESLQIKESQEVLHISRVRTADGVPLIVSEEYIPTKVPGLNYDISHCKDLENWSIYGFLEDANYKIQTIVTHINAVTANEELVEKLNIEDCTPLLRLEQIHFCNEYNKPILYAINFHNDKILNVMLVRSI